MSNEGDIREHPEESAIETVTTCVRVNGKVHTLAIDPRTLKTSTSGQGCWTAAPSQSLLSCI